MKDNQYIKIGRSNDADVRITDISVSRNHANLSIHNGEFYLKDNNSKFGTLIKIPENIFLLPNRILALQLKKNFVMFSLRKTCWSILKCLK